MSNTIGLPSSPAIAKQVLDDRHKERGVLGKFFGGKEHAPTNIAGFVLGLSAMAVLFLLTLAAIYPEARLTEAIAGFFGIITTTLGFMFGRSKQE